MFRASDDTHLPLARCAARRIGARVERENRTPSPCMFTIEGIRSCRFGASLSNFMARVATYNTYVIYCTLLLSNSFCSLCRPIHHTHKICMYNIQSPSFLFTLIIRTMYIRYQMIGMIHTKRYTCTIAQTSHRHHHTNLVISRLARESSSQLLAFG